MVCKLIYNMQNDPAFRKSCTFKFLLCLYFYIFSEQIQNIFETIYVIIFWNSRIKKMIVKNMFFLHKITESNWEKDERKMLFEKCKGSQILLCIQIPQCAFLWVQTLFF